uniref:Uncharacterized protein n=1 Tax=Pyramimonas obovata TaxID=1411642 RepID=A0A7S0RQK2_9CHLO
MAPKTPARSNKENIKTPGKSPGLGLGRLTLKTPGKSPGFKLGVSASPIKKHAAGKIGAPSPAPASRLQRRTNREGVSGQVDKQHVSYRLLHGAFDRGLYDKYRKKALEDRKKRGPGQSQEMNTLYRFWCYYLRDHSNGQMYADFKKLAMEDAKDSYFYGLQAIFRFYSYGLEKNFEMAKWQDFQELVLSDISFGKWYGLEKLWAYMKFRDASAPFAPLRPEIKKYLKDCTAGDVFQVPEPVRQPLAQKSSNLNPEAPCFKPHAAC